MRQMRPPAHAVAEGLVDESEEDDGDNEEEVDDQPVPPPKKLRVGVMTLINVDDFSNSPDIEQVIRNQVELAKALNAITTHLTSSPAGGTVAEAPAAAYPDKYVKSTTIFECKALFDGIVTTDGVGALWDFTTKQLKAFLDETVFPKFNLCVQGRRFSASDTLLMKVLKPAFPYTPSHTRASQNEVPSSF